jgi:apolipoprotein N-acyltransferase
MPTGAGVAAGPFHSQSNEAWFSDSQNLKNQMFASLVFRAVENRKTIIKAGNKTYGVLVYPSGKQEKLKTGNNTKKLTVNINSGSSLFARTNNYLMNIVLVLLLILLMKQIIQKLKS